MQRKSYVKMDLSGRRVGNYTVIEKSKNGRSTWVCKCDCGKVFDLCASRILEGKQISCGCVAKKCQRDFAESHITHGDSYTRLYKTYRGMLDRCYNKNLKIYKDYGGRGISVCDEWRNSYEAFRDWALKAGYQDGLGRALQSIDRIDVNGNYEPSNCRWATSKVQQKNQRNTVRYMYRGDLLTISEFEEKYGITEKYFAYGRFKRGRSFDEILKEWSLSRNIPDYFVEAAEYAKQIGVHPSTVKKRIRCGQLSGERIGRKWYVTRKE